MESTPKPRYQKGKRTRQRIYATAVELIKKHGYHQVTVSEICQACGIAKGSFYVHYASKEDIVRQSYYAEMGEYLQSTYGFFLRRFPDATVDQKVAEFLKLQLVFAQYAGHELTCLALSMDLSGCVTGPADHFERRAFSQTLLELLEEHQNQLPRGRTVQDAFFFFESLVQGMMATWCFTGGTTTALESGKRMIEDSVASFWAR